MGPNAVRRHHGPSRCLVDLEIWVVMFKRRGDGRENTNHMGQGGCNRLNRRPYSLSRSVSVIHLGWLNIILVIMPRMKRIVHVCGRGWRRMTLLAARRVMTDRHNGRESEGRKASKMPGVVVDMLGTNFLVRNLSSVVALLTGTTTTSSEKSSCMLEQRLCSFELCVECCARCRG